MISEPTLNEQAELLIAGLAKLEVTLDYNQVLEIIEPQEGAPDWVLEFKSLNWRMGREEALDFLAKLGGFKGWNEYLADNRPAHHKRIVISTDMAWYLNKTLYSCKAIPFTALAENCLISDLQLAAYFRHSSENSCTELHRWTSANGDVYRLHLVGSFKFLLPFKDGTASYVSSGDGFTPGYMRAIAAYIKEPGSPLNECIHAPYFEWVNEYGEPIEKAFHQIPLDASQEMSRIRQVAEYLNL